MKKLLAIVLCLIMVFAFAGCGEAEKIIVAEKESAGEGVAQNEKDSKLMNTLQLTPRQRLLWRLMRALQMQQ